MKIAAVTDNGTTISSHFGRARQYVVVTVEDGKIVAQELRDKTACQHGHHDDHSHHEEHTEILTVSEGTPAISSHDPHNHAVQIIADCAIVLARGMGQGMYANLQRAGIRPILTTVAPIATAVTAYIEGRLKDHPELVH